jgi:hypothetical protein
MTTTSARWLLWVPRVFAILAGLFLGLFALDAFSEGKPLAQALADFIIHLAPAALLFGIVALAWRREWIGGTAFVGLAIAYAASNMSRPDWILTISGPLAVVGALFFWSWRQHAQFHAVSGPPRRD